MNNRIIIIFTALMLGAISYAQEQRFVEVTVSHEIELKALSSTYIIQVDPLSDLDYALEQLEEMDEEQDPLEEDLENDMELAQIRQEMEKKGLKCEDAPVETAIPFYTEEGFLVHINTEKDEATMNEILKERSSIKSNLYHVDYEEQSKYLADALPELHKKAKEEASTIAKSLNKSIGEIIGLKEIPPLDPGYSFWGNYGELMQRMLWKEFKQESDTKKVNLTYAYRFELK